LYTVHLVKTVKRHLQRSQVGRCSLLVGWSLTALSAQKGYIVPCRN